MRVVDTSAWIEWLEASPTGKKVAAQLPDDTDWLVPTIVQFELAKWLLRERADARRTEGIISFSASLVVTPLTSPLALAGAVVSRDHRLPAADALVYATAREFAADLVTCDAHFRDVPGVIYIPKTG